MQSTINLIFKYKDENKTLQFLSIQEFITRVKVSLCIHQIDSYSPKPDDIEFCFCDGYLFFIALIKGAHKRIE